MSASDQHAAEGESSPQLTVTRQLCGSVAHDLRGVLMAIQLSAEELTNRGARVIELQSEIQTAIERATQLVSDLTTLTHPSGGHPEVFDISPEIDRMRRMLCRNAPAGALVEFELTPEACLVAAPRMDFKRVLLTLFNGVAERLSPPNVLCIETAVSAGPGAGDPTESVVVSVGSGAARASDWTAAERIPRDRSNSPASGELGALLLRLDAELYCQGTPSAPSHFWLLLPRANSDRATGLP
ncbi:MAG TPA: hypothetical protein VFU02_20530 [Polyangiaceae bacterium]|nr:hypothetical protein [Polyangiaceae bacterium]